MDTMSPQPITDTTDPWGPMPAPLVGPKPGWQLLEERQMEAPGGQDDVECPSCRGAGEHELHRDPYSEEAWGEREPCPDCSGKGVIRHWWAQSIERKARRRKH
jgi:hypothetical protein